MMNKVEKTFKGQKNLVPYIMAGDPDLNTTKKIVRTMANSGADIIELGIPYSDPLADGPTIQAAGQRALKNNITLGQVIELASELEAEVDKPLVLMGYYNSILRYGKSEFIAHAKDAGVAGVIVPDLPYSEDEDFYQQLEKSNLAGILLVSPNTPDDRLQVVGRQSTGFLYCVSLLGVTGDERGPEKHIADYISRVRQHTDLPLALGFGIDGPEKASRYAEYVEGIVIGSAIIKLINQNSQNSDKMLSDLSSFISAIKKAIT